MNTNKERIKPIPGYEGYYATSSGDIITTRTKHPQILSARVHNDYLHVRVKLGLGRQTRKKMPVHQLVTTAFHGMRPDGHMTRHLNGNRFDNRSANLAWGTSKENMRDAIEHGTAQCLKWQKLSDEDVVSIRQLLSEGMEQKLIAGLYGVSQTHISCIKLGKTRTYRPGGVKS